MTCNLVIPKVNGYILAEKLGSGSYADVYKAFKKSEKRDVVAIKCVAKNNLTPTAQNNLVSEIKILKSLSHENIVKLKDFLWDDNYIFIIMEYCSGGNLSNFIHMRQRLSENICQRFLQQLAHALSYLREKNISHFDLKPQNIFLASKTYPILKIGDFGLAQYISETDKNSLIKGSPLYMAPEMVLKKEYDATADIWSVGVILYECLFGKAPYSSKSFEELINKIKSNKPIEIPLSANISQNCQDFLRKCLERDISKRLDFNGFFNHPFVDLKHSPNPNSLNEASVYLSLAIQQDKLGNYDDAFSAYDEALKYLYPVLYMERDATKRVNLRKKIVEYVSRMEVLKTKIKSESGETPQVVEMPSILKVTPTQLKYEGNLPELIQLTKTTPQLNTAIEIAQSAELYEREGKNSLALEKYEMALGKLLLLLQNEPKGKRRDLLVEETNRWMHQAERIKDIQQDSDMTPNEESFGDGDKTCCLQ